MGMHSLHQNLERVQHISGAKTATVTPSSGVDLRDFVGGVDVAIHVGVVTNIANSPQPTWTFHFEESDSESSGFTAVTSSDDVDIEGSLSPVTTPDSSTGVFLTIDAAAEDDNTYRVGYTGVEAVSAGRRHGGEHAGQHADRGADSRRAAAEAWRRRLSLIVTAGRGRFPLPRRRVVRARPAPDRAGPAHPPFRNRRSRGEPTWSASI
jgi:hypothetical protein